ncbi:MAG: cytochrome c [Solirubrobacterales bacterium]
MNEQRDTNEQLDEERRTAIASAWLLGFGVGAVVLGLLAVTYLIGFNHGKGEGAGKTQATRSRRGEGAAKPAPAGPGKALFAQNCGGCHTLADAGTSGAVGPNLDDLQPDEAQVIAAIENGGAGSGTMPPGLVQGGDAQAVAAYVAGSAGK